MPSPLESQNPASNIPLTFGNEVTNSRPQSDAAGENERIFSAAKKVFDEFTEQAQSDTENRLSSLENLPAEILTSILFRNQDDFKAIIPVCHISSHIRQIVISNIEDSNAFKQLCCNHTNKEIQSQFKHLLEISGIDIAQSLALKFFNHASNEVLSSFFEKKSSEEIASFLNLIKDQKLDRQSFRVSHPILLHFWNEMAHSELRTLDFGSFSVVSKSDFEKFTKFKALKKLTVSNPYLSEIFFEHLKKTLSLTLNDLSITKLEFKPAYTSYFALLRNLQILSLTESNLSDQDLLRFLPSLKKIKNLNLSGCKGIKFNFNELHSLKKTLEKLTVKNCSGIDAESVRNLANFRALTHLNLENCFGLNTLALMPLSKLDNLVSLNLNGCDKLLPENLKIVQSMKRLETLELNGWKTITDENLAAIAKNSDLKKLNLQGCIQIEGKFLNSELTYRNLRSLNLMHTKMDNAGIGSICMKFPNLEDLNLDFCSDLTDDAFEKISALTHLKHLSLQGVSITDATIKKLMSIHSLVSIDLSGCLNVSMDAIHELYNALPEATITDTL